MRIGLPDLKNYAGMLRKGLIIEMAPEIAKGMLVELFKSKKVTAESACDWVQSNSSLWKTLEPKEQRMLKNLAVKGGNLDWLEAAWVIAAIKKDLPAVASLFLGWKKANNWLIRQVEIIKKEVAAMKEGE